MITAVDAHACGEPGRVITGGVLDVPGQTMFDKKNWLHQNADHIRLRMLREPRGYPASNCNLILPSNHPEADAGFVIMEQVEYPPMSGTNTICVVTVLIETGMVKVTEPVTHLKLETPAGLISVAAEVHHGKVRKVTFRNVPAFATHLDAKVEVRGLGTVTVDVAYGGMFYVIAEAAPLGFFAGPGRSPRDCQSRRNDQSCDAGAVTRDASRERGDIRRNDRAAFRSAFASGRAPPQYGRRFDWSAGLVPPGIVDRRARSLSLRDGNVRKNGRTLCQGPARAL